MQEENPYKSPLAVVGRREFAWKPERIGRWLLNCLGGYFALGSTTALVLASIELVSGGRFAVFKIGPVWAIWLLLAAETYCYVQAARCWFRRSDRRGTAYFALGSVPFIILYIAS